MNTGSSEPPHDPVWDLLAQAPRPEPDVWFTARTLARCRREGSRFVTGERFVFARADSFWHWILGGGVAVGLAILSVTLLFQSEQISKQKKVQDAFAIMASMDNDSDSPSNSSWQDSSL